MGLKEFNQILETFQAFGGQECVFSALHGFLLGSGPVSMFHGVDVMARHWHTMWVPTTQEGKISGIALYKEFLDRLQADMMLPGRGNTLLWYVDDKDHTPVQKQKEQKSRDDKKTAAQDMYPPDVSYEFTERGILNTDNNRYFKQFMLIDKGVDFVPYDANPEGDDDTYQDEEFRFPNIHLDGFKASRHLRKPFFRFFIQCLKQNPLGLFDGVVIKNTHEVFIVFEIGQVHRFHHTEGYSLVDPATLLRIPQGGEADKGVYQWVTRYRDTKACVIHSCDSDMWAIGLCMLDQLGPTAFKYPLLFRRYIVNSYTKKVKDTMFNLHMVYDILMHHAEHLVVDKDRPFGVKNMPLRLFLASWILSGSDFLEKNTVLHGIVYPAILTFASQCIDQTVALNSPDQYQPFFDRFASGVGMAGYATNKGSMAVEEAREDFAFNMEYWYVAWEENDITPKTAPIRFIDFWKQSLTIAEQRVQTTAPPPPPPPPPSPAVKATTFNELQAALLSRTNPAPKRKKASTIQQAEKEADDWTSQQIKRPRKTQPPPKPKPVRVPRARVRRPRTPPSPSPSPPPRSPDSQETQLAATQLAATQVDSPISDTDDEVVALPTPPAAAAPRRQNWMTTTTATTREQAMARIKTIDIEINRLEAARSKLWSLVESS